MPNKLRLYLTPKAEDDLEEIYFYTLNEWGFDQADLYQDIISAGMMALKLHPEVGKLFQTKNGAYRTLSIKKHIIYYTLEDKQIIVVRILHGSMDRERWID